MAVFAEGAAAQAAEEAGADIVGTDELMQQIQAGEFNFDAAVATPDQMGKVGRLGQDPRPPRPHAQPEARHRHQRRGEGHQGAQGRPRGVPRRPLRHRARRPRQGELHPEQLAENYGAVYDEILRMKPAAAKGKYVKSITVSGTMTPGVSVDSSVTRAYTESAE